MAYCENCWCDECRPITINREPNMEPHDDIGDLMTLKEFEASCGSMFIDYDGHGYYATEIEQTDIVIKPGDVLRGIHRKDFTHVKWYNK